VPRNCAARGDALNSVQISDPANRVMVAGPIRLQQQCKANAPRNYRWRVMITNQQSKSFQDNKMPGDRSRAANPNESCVRQLKLKFR